MGILLSRINKKVVPFYLYKLKLSTDNQIIIKVGISQNLEQRIRAFKPFFKVELLEAIEGEENYIKCLEKWVHSTFKMYKLRGNKYKNISGYTEFYTPEMEDYSLNDMEIIDPKNFENNPLKSL